MSKHTQGPWATSSGRIYPAGKACSTVASVARDIKDWTLFNEEDARRIVASVNACEGIGTEELELCKLSSLDAVNKFMGFKNERDEVLAALEKLSGDVEALIKESCGVYGLHQNSSPAPWGELVAGGRHEEWLLSLSDAAELIAKLKDGAA